MNPEFFCLSFVVRQAMADKINRWKTVMSADYVVLFVLCDLEDEENQ